MLLPTAASTITTATILCYLLYRILDCNVAWYVDKAAFPTLAKSLVPHEFI